jgi:hypothetical protein
MNVVENQQGPGVQVGVEVVVFEIRKRVAVRTVCQRRLKCFGEAILWQSDLRGALHKSDYTRAQRRRPADIHHAAGSVVQRKCGVMRAQMREQKRARAGPSFHGVADVQPPSEPGNGFERPRRECADVVQTGRYLKDVPANLVKRIVHENATPVEPLDVCGFHDYPRAGRPGGIAVSTCGTKRFVRALTMHTKNRVENLNGRPTM